MAEKIFVFGKILQDIILETNLELADSQFNFDFGEKTLVADLITEPGGGAANVTFALKKLGFDPLIVGILGKDTEGTKIRSLFKKRHIATTQIGASTVATGKSIIILGKNRSHTALIYPGANTQIKESDLNWNQIKKCRWWYLMSWGNANPKIVDAIVVHKEKLGNHLAFNPGEIQLEHLNLVKKILAVTDILFVNQAELEMILEHKLDLKNCGKALIKAVSLGPKIVVLTLGARGSMVYNGFKFYSTPIYPVATCDALGAGDGYSSAFLAWFIKTGDLREAMKAATFNSGSVVKGIGALSGQLNSKQIKAMIKKVPLKIIEQDFHQVE
jgi:ribokinase